MKMIMFSFSVFLASCLATFAELPFNDGFSKKNISDYLENTTVLMQDASFRKMPGSVGTQVLRLTYDNEVYAEFKSVAVVPGKAYSLRFRAAWINDETVETNPIFEYAWLRGAEWYITLFPIYEISFSDINHKPIKRYGTTLKQTILCGKWTDYLCTFVPPVEAAYMNLKIKSGANLGVLYIDNVQFESSSENLIDLSTLAAVHGNIYGLNIDHYRCTLPNGKTTFKSPNLIVPITQGTYELNLKLHNSYKGHHNVRAFFLDSAKKRIGTTSLGNKWQAPLVVTVPKDTMYLKLSFGAFLVEQIKINKMEP